MHSYTLRPATPDDLALTYDITREAMRGYVEQTWGRWDEDEQTRKHRDNYTPATHRLIVVGQVVGGEGRGKEGREDRGEARVEDRVEDRGEGRGEVAGLVATEDWADDPRCLWLVKLYLRERYRGRGLGTRVLLGVLRAAAAAARPVRLRVLRVNTRAQALYRAHGFRVIEETPERLIMEWRGTEGGFERDGATGPAARGGR